jgi:Ca2+-binding RTX toxin-like protein
MTIEFSLVTELTLSSERGAPSPVFLAKDLNGDGNLDLITDFSEFNNGITFPVEKTGVAVLYGTGGGQFAAEQKYAVEQVLPNPAYQEAYQSYQNFLNRLPAGVTPPPFVRAISPTINSPIRITEIEVGDVDRDGKLDLITVGRDRSQQSSVISVLKGTGSSFSAAVNSPLAATGNFPGGLAIADFNRDGNLDVAAIPQGNIRNASSTNEQQVAILLGDGTGKFGSEKTIFLGINTADVVTADFNGDGLTDLAVAGQGKTIDDIDDIAANVSVLLSNGEGEFSPPNTVPIPSNTSFFQLLAADFNSDGKIDLGTSQGYLVGDGTGQLKTFQPFEGINSVGGKIVANDFNNDGKLDVAGANGILLGDGTGNYTIPDSAIIDRSALVVLGDLDQDGKPDIAVRSSKTISVLLNRTTSSNLLVISNGAIDASIEQGRLTLDLKKGTLQLGGIDKPLKGSYSFVRGTQQADRITGGQRGEGIDGQAGNDVIMGGDGSDSLVGGFGSDTLTGGKGKDRFTFGSYGQLIPFNRAMGVDKITDFESGEDKIQLFRGTFTAFTSRRISFESVTTIKEAQKSKALIVYIPETGSLFYNQNRTKAGFGSGRQFADLTNGLKLQAQDFLLFK